MTRGRATRSSGRPPRRHRRTTSTTFPRSGPSDRCSTSGTAGRPPTERVATMAMTTETHPLPVEHNPLASMPHDTHGGISNPVLGMLLFITSEVMFFGGLFAAYFSIRANAAQWPPINADSGAPFQLAILPFVGPATILLITSSFTCQYVVL